MNTVLQRIRPWHVLGAIALVCAAVAVFFIGRSSGPAYTRLFSDPVRQTFYDSGMASCMAAARENPVMIELGVLEADMHGYCHCAMSETAESFTMEEIMFIDEHQDIPESAHAKMGPIVAACWQTFIID